MQIHRRLGLRLGVIFVVLLLGLMSPLAFVATGTSAFSFASPMQEELKELHGLCASCRHMYFNPGSYWCGNIEHSGECRRNRP
ncbi:hypothetical protein KDL44_10570 [bacterium]|nr:hypothetical protein [bacterium]